MKKLPLYIRFSAHFYLAILAVSFIFRIVLLVLEWSQLEQVPTDERLLLIAEAFVIGMRFDTIIITYLLLLPVVLALLFQLKVLNRCVTRIAITASSSLLLGVLVAVFCLDLAYFAYNGSRVTIAIFQWNASPDIVLSMIVQETSYLLLLITLFVVSSLFGYGMYRYLGFVLERDYAPMKRPIFVHVLLGILFVFFLFSGVRGSFLKGALKLNDGTISKYQFINQLTLNPAFVLFRDMRNTVALMDDQQALELSKIYLKAEASFSSPIGRNVLGDSVPKRLNVVVILMESMTANNMSFFGNTQSLTPVLDTLANRGIFFDNAYSSGIHTNNGIFSTLFSFPSFWRLRPLSAVNINEYSGFSGVLKHNGYHTAFFTTQDPAFDNISEFMPKNHFDTVVSVENYPKEQIVNTFGVPDHVQFDYAVDYLTQVSNEGAPFFASILTSSNHPPIVIPDSINFIPKNSANELAIIEYADWSLGQFFEKAKRTDWFAHTVFVLSADHGSKQYDSPYDVIRSFNHIPILIVSDSLVPEPYVYSDPMGQIDAFPTVMGLLGFPYVNTTFGVDVLKDQRPYTYFSADDKIGCIDRDYLYVFRKSGSESLYKYQDGDLTDYSSILVSKKDSMSRYLKAQVQAAQWCITNDKTNWVLQPGCPSGIN